jgi:hypothetical protein
MTVTPGTNLPLLKKYFLHVGGFESDSTELAAIL